MPEEYVRAVVLKSFIGAGVHGRKGDVVDFPKRHFNSYAKRGYLREQATYQTKVVEPQTTDVKPAGGLTENHPYVNDQVEITDDSFSNELTVDDLEQRGPYYTLPDGRKVLGRVTAEEELAKYNATKYESDS